MAESWRKALGGRLIWRKASPGPQKRFSRNQISYATSRFPDDFIVCIEEILVKDIVQVYIKEVFAKYKVLNKIILDKDIKFILVF